MAGRIVSRTRTELVHSIQILRPIPTLLSSPLSSSFSTKPTLKPHHSPVADLLKGHGFPPSKIESFLNRNHFLLDSNPVDVETSLGILSTLRIPQNDAVLMVASCPGVLDSGFLRKWEVGFSRFGDLVIPPSVIRSVLEFSRKSGIDPDEFGKCLRVLKGLGLRIETFYRVLEGFPGVIRVEENEVSKYIEVLGGIGFDMNGVDKVLYLYPEVLGFGVEGRLMPLLNEFKGLGFSKELVCREVHRDPRVLGMELGELSRCLQLLRTLKCREPIKLRIFGRGEFRAGVEVKLRVDCLCQHGLIRREALKVLWKEPRVIIYDVRDVKKKIEYLVNTMGFSISCLVNVPEYLGVNFEKQIVPRYSVIAHLHAIGALGDDVGLDRMIKLSRLRFYNMYVKPYPECEKLFGRLSGDSKVNNKQSNGNFKVNYRYPSGLWEIFKPKRPPASKEDVKNIKCFMEAIA